MAAFFFMDYRTTAEITKLDEERMLAFGWASVAIGKDGKPVTDLQDDVIREAELAKTGYEFALNFRGAGEMHQRLGIGRLVESVVLTREKQQAMGIPEGTVPVGWWVGFKVDDPDVWARVKSGEYRAFSIGGRAERKAI